MTRKTKSADHRLSQFRAHFMQRPENDPDSAIRTAMICFEAT